MNRSLAIFLILSGLLASVGILIASIFADRVASFRMKDRNGRYVEVFRPRSASLIANFGIAIGFIGIVASLIVMFAYRNRLGP